MQTSESVTKIAPAFLAAQKAITFAAKDAVNPHLKSKYADLPAVIDAVKEALNENGIAFIQTATHSEDSRLHLTTTLLHESGEWFRDTAVIPVPKQDPQGYGAALSYLRRYSLSAFTGLYQDDDDGERSKGVAANQVADWLISINDASTMDELKTAFEGAISAAKEANDAGAQRQIIAAKNRRKEALSQ